MRSAVGVVVHADIGGAGASTGGGSCIGASGVRFGLSVPHAASPNTLSRTVSGFFMIQVCPDRP